MVSTMAEETSTPCRNHDALPQVADKVAGRVPVLWMAAFAVAQT